MVLVNRLLVAIRTTFSERRKMLVAQENAERKFLEMQEKLEKLERKMQEVQEKQENAEREMREMRALVDGMALRRELFLLRFFNIRLRILHSDVFKMHLEQRGNHLG
jgi:hypothetical protein